MSALRGLTAGSLLCCAACAVLAVAGALAFAGSIAAQDPGAGWEQVAGGKMAFEVASVKLNASAYDFYLNIAQEPYDGEDFTPSGGLFDAKDWPLWMYIAFAYKLPYDQLQLLKAEAPKWVIDHSYDIQGRAPGNPSKDQYRLMMQALLADRFKMAVSWQTRQGPSDALDLANVGKTGSQLRRFPDGFPCATSVPKAGRGPAASDDAPTPANAMVPGGFPAYCGLLGGFAFVQMVSKTGGTRYGARNVSWEQIESRLALMGGQMHAFDRPVVDKTGLSGTYDIALDLAPPVPGDRNARAETFLEALKEQLGIKVEATTGPFQMLAIDHIEEPSAN